MQGENFVGMGVFYRPNRMNKPKLACGAFKMHPNHAAPLTPWVVAR
jgi:hypothetical protein